MAAYCAAVELPFIPEALTWEPGERPEWRRSARWHVDVSASSGFAPRERTYAHTVESSDELARFAAHHLPFYEAAPRAAARRRGTEPVRLRLLTGLPCRRSGHVPEERVAGIERLSTSYGVAGQTG